MVVVAVAVAVVVVEELQILELVVLHWQRVLVVGGGGGAYGCGGELADGCDGGGPNR